MMSQNSLSGVTCSRELVNLELSYCLLVCKHLLTHAQGHHILAYYGDLDMACDHLSGMWFTESLNLTVRSRV
jgi:hypothetical protein